MTKSEIRQAALKRRDAVAPELASAYAARLAEVGLQLVRDATEISAPVVSLYSPIGSEPDMGPLAAALRTQGVSLALPVDWSSGTALMYRAWRPGDRLAPGPLGIGEPIETAPSCEPDILFTPLAAFDRRGHRIGYGAGNVDRTLAVLRSRKLVLVVGVAYATQEEVWLPVQAHDEPLDVIITEHEVVTCRPE
jgi:5-formyltetrahydrofolate cyclo-ligase